MSGSSSSPSSQELVLVKGCHGCVWQESNDAQKNTMTIGPDCHLQAQLLLLVQVLLVQQDRVLLVQQDRVLLVQQDRSGASGSTGSGASGSTRSGAAAARAFDVCRSSGGTGDGGGGCSVG